MATEIGTIHLDRITQPQLGGLGRQRLAQFVGKHEGRLVLHIEIAGELQGRCTLGRVHEQTDGSQQIDEGQLPTREDRA
jgi:hypothetical protein